MDRFWTKSYPQGVPADVDVHACRSIVDLFERSVEKFGEKPAFKLRPRLSSDRNINHSK